MRFVRVERWPRAECSIDVTRNFGNVEERGSVGGVEDEERKYFTAEWWDFFFVLTHSLAIPSL